MAFQDSFAKPLADELVDLFRVDDLTYVRTGNSVYNPTTGQVTSSETLYQKAGAITKSGSLGEGTTGSNLYIEVWINSSFIDNQFPTPDDYLIYQGRKYNITEVDPRYSGDTDYACKVRAES